MTAMIRFEPVSVPVSDERGHVAGARCTLPDGYTLAVIPREGPSIDVWIHADDLPHLEAAAGDAWHAWVDALDDAAQRGADGESGSVDIADFTA